MAGCPPGAEGVLEQEPDHVVLGEQLGHRPQVGAADLALGGVDLVLLVLLPELVDPPQRVVGREHLDRQTVEDLLQRVPTLGREAQPHAGVVETEDAGQDLGGEARCDRPAVGLAQLGCQVLAIGERHRRLVLRDAAAGRSRRGTGQTAGGATARRRTRRRAARGRRRAGATSPAGRCAAPPGPHRGAQAGGRQNTPSPSSAAREALSAARRAARTEVSSCLRRRRGRARMSGLR